jgi:hypothetical protein
LRKDKARNIVVGRAICLPDHICPGEIICARQTNACLSRRNSLKRSSHRRIILEGEGNRLFERESLLLICAGLRAAGLAEAYQNDERDRHPSQSGTMIL